jgi:pimeloyl-ACP methyl ester carboxylesterase
MASLADEVAFTKRIIALQDGPVILVGHSWGGAVITQAGDDPKVAGLVYVAAYPPEVGQSANDASTASGRTEGQKEIRVDGEKFATGPMFDEKLTVAA